MLLKTIKKSLDTNAVDFELLDAKSRHAAQDLYE